MARMIAIRSEDLEDLRTQVRDINVLQLLATIYLSWVNIYVLYPHSTNIDFF